MPGLPFGVAAKLINSQGSSAMQIVAALGSKVGQLYNITRSKAWVALPSVVGVYKAHLGHDIDPTNPATCEYKLRRLLCVV